MVLGKQTQTNKIYERLINKSYDVFKTSFPNYDNLSSGPVKEYLSGKISENPNDISPKAASSFYAVDRYISYKENIEKYYLDDKTIIIFDRYVSSNLLHQGAKLYNNSKNGNQKKLDEYISWLNNFEYGDLELPVATMTFFLYVPLETTLKLIENRKNKFNNDDKKDIHESDTTHLKNAINSGLYCAKKLGWKIINCVNENGLRTPDDINDEIYEIIVNSL